MRIGYNTWSMATVPYQVFIPELARIGYTAIALSVVPGYGIGGKRVPNAADLATLTSADRRRIKEDLEQREIELPSVVGNASVVEEDPETSRAHLQRLRDTIDFAVEVKPNGQAHLPTVNTGTGGRTDEFAAKQQVMVDRLGELAEYAARRGVTIAIEPHVGNAIDRPERAEWLIHTVNSPHVRLDLDISHFEVAAFPMEDVMRRLVPLSASMEIKDQNMKYAGEPEPPGWRIAGNGVGRGTAPDGRPTEHQFLLGGEGDFDLPAYLRLLSEVGWSGAVAFEASVQCQQRPDYDPIAAAERTYRWMRAGWEQAGVSLD
jgi:sugar phosphate isomerase/epimerase